MNVSVWLSLFGTLLVSSTALPHEKSQEKFDVCSLISEADIEAIQGEPVIATKSSTPGQAAFAVSQCFYTLRTFTKSVSLELTRRGPDNTGADGPREHWRKLFHPPSQEKEKQRTDTKEPDEPRPVAGIGDEAFWTGNATVGALYVLKGDAYLRISIGGAEDESIRIQKTKRLAGKALERL